jgi:hypothetical protein
VRAAFVISRQIGGAGWSTAEQQGRFLAPAGTRIEIDPAVMLSLQASHGPDVCTLLLNLAMLAKLDDQDRLVVDGGMERVRAVVGWGREKASRVFEQVRSAGFVVRSQEHDPSGVGRRQQFGTTVLVLDPALYAAAPIADTDGPGSGEPAPAIQRGSTGVTGVGKSGSGQPASTTQREDHRPVPGGAAGGSSGSGQPDTAATTVVGSSGNGQPDIAESDDVGREDPGRADVGFSASGQPDSMDDMDDAENTSSSSSTTSSSPGANLDAVHTERVRRLRSALGAIGFSDAAEIVRGYDLDLIEAWVQHVVEAIEADPTRFTNPGGFLRTQLDRGEPPPRATADIAAAVRALIGSADSGGDEIERGRNEESKTRAEPDLVAELSPEEAPEVDVAAVEDRLAALPEGDRDALMARVDAHFSSGPHRVVLEHVDDHGRAEIRAAYLARLLDSDGYPP